MMTRKEETLNAQLVLVRAALRPHPEGLTWGELRSRLRDLAAERIAQVSRKRPDLEATSDRVKREKWLRHEAGWWSSKAPTTSQLRELLTVLIEGHEVRVVPKLGPGTPKTRYIYIATEAWWEGLETWLRGLMPRRREIEPVVLSTVIKDLPLFSGPGVGIPPGSERLRLAK